MARTAVPVMPIDRSGIAPPAEVNGDPTNNHTLVNNGMTWLLVRNAHATLPQTLTVTFGFTVDDQPITPRTYSIPAVSSRYIGPFPVAHYGTALNHDVSTSDLKLSAFKLAD